MSTWRNATGLSLSSPGWLETHHRAKLPERTRFAESLAQFAPTKLVDLGCGTGLWLDLLDKWLADDCEFVGVDLDAPSLELAHERARGWTRRSHFVQRDVCEAADEIANADLVLAFNVFPYVLDAGELLSRLHQQQTSGRLVVRQYDGSTIRVGPIPNEDRSVIDSSLRASLEASSTFDHYAMDRTYAAIRRSNYTVESLAFESVERHQPFSAEFTEYFGGTVDWMRGHLSDDAAERLARAVDSAGSEGLYFAAADLVAVLSVGS